MNNFVTYDIALELSNKGFREPCFGYYNDDKLIVSHSAYPNGIDIELNMYDYNSENSKLSVQNKLDSVTEEEDYACHLMSHMGIPRRKMVFCYKEPISAPLWQQVIEWFINRHRILICIDFYVEDNIIEYHFRICEPNTWREQDIFVMSGFKTHNEAMKVSIEKALTLI